MNTDKIKLSALDAMAGFLKPESNIDPEEIKECIASAVVAAIKEYDRQDD